MRGLIRRIGPCTLAPRKDYFIALCQSIYSQQISTAVAAALFGRFRAQFPRRCPTPAAVLEFLARGEDAARSVGLSRQKRLYLQDLAAHFAQGQIPTRRFAVMDDEQIIESLVQVKGIGRWTVEMFLIFCLNRPDVWPIDDFGLKTAVQREYGLKEFPAKQALLKLGERFRPWRTVATWYLWRASAKTAL